MTESVFLSYSHDSSAHVKRVRELAQRLISAGIPCSWDAQVDSPPEGWPKWMINKITAASLVLVVCTDSYRRRFEGNENRGVGKGATWEGSIITQAIYDSSASTNKFIPLIFSREDTHCIPQALRGQTFYIVTEANDFLRLYRRLTEQSDGIESKLGPIIELPTQVRSDAFTIPQEKPGSPDLAAIHHFLDTLPNGMPIDLLASQFCGQSADLDLRLSADSRFQFDDHHTLWKSNQSTCGLAVVSTETLQVSLRELVDYISQHRDRPGIVQLCENARSLASRVVVDRPDLVVPLFRAVEKPLKQFGRKRLVYDCAMLTIEATHRPNRSDHDVELEAQALICGTSWVLQRVGHLDDAFSSANRSLQLGSSIESSDNPPFCNKCLGRLSRLRAEANRNDSRQFKDLIETSIRHLNEAIALFSSNPRFGPADPEVGDCHSLLARTYLIKGDIRTAFQHAMDAHRLVQQSGKDWLDLLLVHADIGLSNGKHDLAESHCNEVINSHDAEDAQQSEIAMRAYLTRGRINRVSGRLTAAIKDFERASQIARDLKEDIAFARAQWEVLRCGRISDDFAKRMDSLSFPEKVFAAESHLEKSAAAASSGMAFRKEPNDAYWEKLKKEARHQAAKKDIPWHDRA